MCQCVHENQMVMAECVEQLEFTPRWDGGCDSCSPKLLVGGGAGLLCHCVCCPMRAVNSMWGRKKQDWEKHACRQ